MLCDVCGEAIINQDRSWPRANNVPTEPVYFEGREVRESHLACFRIAREYGDRIAAVQHRLGVSSLRDVK
jgi:hypothetical protein